MIKLPEHSTVVIVGAGPSGLMMAFSQQETLVLL